MAHLVVMRLQHLEGAAQARQHAEAEDIDLQEIERLEVVLVPFDDGALVHRGILDRNDLVEPAARDREAADVLRKVPGKPHQQAGERTRFSQALVGRIEAGAPRRPFRDALHRPAPQRARQRADGVAREPEHLADLADGAAAAIADDGRRKAGMVAAIGAVDVLDHLLAAFVLEIDVDVGRLVALIRDEALEQKVGLHGVDVGDAEAIADHRVRRRTAPLAEDLLLFAGEADDVVHRQEERRVIEPADQLELLGRGRCALLRNSAGIAPVRAFFSKGDERFLRRRESFAGFVRVLGLLQFIRARSRSDRGTASSA